MDIDVATLHVDKNGNGGTNVATKAWAPPHAKESVTVDFSRLDTYEVRIYQDLGGAELRAAIELSAAGAPTGFEEAVNRQKRWVFRSFRPKPGLEPTVKSAKKEH